MPPEAEHTTAYGVVLKNKEIDQESNQAPGYNYQFTGNGTEECIKWSFRYAAQQNLDWGGILQNKQSISSIKIKKQEKQLKGGLYIKRDLGDMSIRHKVWVLF